MVRTLRRPLVNLLVLLVALPALVVAPAAQAALAPTPVVGAGGAPADREADLADIRRELERRQVHQRLVDLGLDPAEASARLDALSDEEVHAAADQVRSLVPGGDGLGLAVGLLVVAILVVILLKLLNKEIVIR